MALAFTAGALVVGAAAVTALAALLDQVPAGGVLWVVHVVLWLGLGVVGSVGLAACYRYGPDRDEPRWTWVAPGSVLALVLLVMVTVGLNVYVSHFGSYDATYGALAGIIVLLLWLHLASFIVITGAYVNATLLGQGSEEHPPT